VSNSPSPAGQVTKRTSDLGVLPLGRLLISLSIPSIIGMLVMSLYNLVDTFWVGRLPESTVAIAALTVLFPLQMVAGALGAGTGVGVSSLVARRFGAQRLSEVSPVAGHAVALPAVLGLMLAAISLAAPRELVRLFGATPEIAPVATSYLLIVAFGFPFLLSMMTLNGLYRGAGNTFTPMVIMVVSAGTNALLDPVLMFGWGGLPALGIQGAALATVIAQVGGAGLALLYLCSGRSGYQITVRDLALRAGIVRDIAQVGAPAAVMHSVGSVVGTTFNWVLAGFGAEAIAAQGLSLRIVMVVISFIGGGVHQGLMPIVAYNFGARSYRRMWRAYRAAALGTSTIGLGLATTTFLLASQIVGLFTPDPDLVRLAVIALRLRMATLFLVEPQMMGVASLQGMGKGLHAMLVTLVRQVGLVIPALFLLSHYYGAVGAFAAQPVADTLSAAVTAVILVSVYRRYPPSASAVRPPAVDVEETGAAVAPTAGSTEP